MVTRKNIQIGQRVAPGTVMMSVVPVSALYVDANYKESQLAKVKAGQKVTLRSDLYGDDGFITDSSGCSLGQVPHLP